jgi:excisionase family DNA binding protein
MRLLGMPWNAMAHVAQRREPHMEMMDEDRRRLTGNSAAVERLAVRPLEAAMMLGESRTTIYRLINAGQLDAVKRGSSTLVLVGSIRRYLASLPRFTARRSETAGANT